MYEIFKMLCEARGITTYRFCKETGINSSTISTWKTKNSVCSSRLAGIVAKYFGVSVDYILTGEKEENADAEVKEEKPIDLKDEFNRLEKMLKSGEVRPLYFDGQPVDQESINLLLDQIKISVAFIAKQRKK